MRLNTLFSEAGDDPYAKYWNPAEREIEKQKAADKEYADWMAQGYGAQKHMQYKAQDAEAELIKKGMNPDDSPLTRVDRGPFETRQVRFQNALYTIKAYMVDTYDGPEIRVEFYGPDGKICDASQESMSVSGQIEMWMEQGDHGPVRRRDETKF